MKSLRATALLIGATLVVALPSGAREVLTPEEQAEIELEKRRQAEPVLECSPTALKAKVTQGQTSILHLTIGNTGGRTLRWSVLSAPKWVRLDRMSGKLAFEEEERLVLVADPEGLPGGIASGKIVIAAPGAEGSPVTIALALDVPAPPPSETPRAEPAPSGPEALVPESPVKPEKPRSWPLGLRVGLVSFEGTTHDALPASSVGISYRSRVLELGVDYFKVSLEDDYGESTVVVLSAAARMSIGSRESSKISLVGQVQSLLENTRSELYRWEGEPSAGALAVGLDVGPFSGRWNVRVCYAFLLSSGNATGQVTTSMGLYF